MAVCLVQIMACPAHAPKQRWLHGKNQPATCAPPLLHSNKRVFYKQRDARFFAPFSYVLSFNLTQLPISTMETLLFSLVGEWWIAQSAQGRAQQHSSH